MSEKKPDQQPALHVSQTETYREGYANSVQVRMSVWDVLLVFGTLRQDTPEGIHLSNFQGIYLSPQQAKALWTVLGNNLHQYEQTFGKLALEPVNQSPMVIPVPAPGGPVN